MAEYFGHWLQWASTPTPTSSRGSSRSTGSARTRAGASCGRASARTPASWPGSSAAARARAEARETPIGLVPGEGALDLEGLDIDPEALAELLHVEPEEWKAQLPQVHEHFAKFGDDLPQALRDQLSELEQRLGAD